MIVEGEKYRPFMLPSTTVEVKYWPQQPDWGPTHVKYPWELLPGHTYLLHKIRRSPDTGKAESEEIEEFEVQTLPRRDIFELEKILYSRTLTSLTSRRGSYKVYGQYRYEDVGLMPHASFTHIEPAHDDGYEIRPERYVYAYSWEGDAWIEDPSKAEQSAAPAFQDKQ